MTEGGFFEPRRMSPTGLAIVVALHAGALGALALMKGPEFIRDLPKRTIATFIPEPVDPPQVEPPPPVDRPVQQPRSVVDSSPTPLQRPADGIILADRTPPPGPIFADTSGEGTLPPIRIEPVLPPVRVEAQLDPRYAGDLQPPYPPSEERAEREGVVRVQVTIGADGRVKDLRKLSATSDAFWRATERHARARWRFRPATLDGRPVEATKVMNVYFRIEG